MSDMQWYYGDFADARRALCRWLLESPGLRHGRMNLDAVDPKNPKPEAYGYIVNADGANIAYANLHRVKEVGFELETWATTEQGRAALQVLTQRLQEAGDFQEIVGPFPKVRKTTAPETPTPRGPRAGTDDRVHEFHRLRKQSPQNSQNWASRMSRCDPRTYQQHCKRVTGEDPISAME